MSPWRDIRDALRKWNQPSSNETADLLGIQQKPVIGKARQHSEPAAA